MKTLKYLIDEKGGLMLKFIAYQVVMSFFGVMMFMAVNVINESLYLVAGIFCLAFYASILGTALWDDGTKDKIRVEGGRIKWDSFLAVKYCLVPYSVTVIISIAYAVLSFAAPKSAVYSVINIIEKVLLSGVYVCFDLGISNPDAPDGVAYLCYTLVTLLICFVSYYLGLKGIGLKNKSKSKRDSTKK